MPAQAQDARAEADRLESVSAEQRERTAAERADVEDSLRNADRMDPDARNRTTADDAAPRRATDETSADDVRDPTVSDEQVTSPRRDFDDSAVREDLRRGSTRPPAVVDEETSRDRRRADRYPNQLCNSAAGPSRSMDSVTSSAAA